MVATSANCGQVGERAGDERLGPGLLLGGHAGDAGEVDRRRRVPRPRPRRRIGRGVVVRRRAAVVVGVGRGVVGGVGAVVVGVPGRGAVGVVGVRRAVLVARAASSSVVAVAVDVGGRRSASRRR